VRTRMVCLLPSTPTYTIPGKKLTTPMCRVTCSMGVAQSKHSQKKFIKKRDNHFVNWNTCRVVLWGAFCFTKCSPLYYVLQCTPQIQYKIWNRALHYRGHLPCSLLPLSCAKGLSSLFIKITGLGMGDFFSSTSSFAIRYYQNSSFESGVGRVLGGAGPHQHGLER
jgi:hypothetical protein